MPGKRKLPKRENIQRHRWWDRSPQVVINFPQGQDSPGRRKSISPKYLVTLDMAPTLFNIYKRRVPLEDPKECKKEERAVRSALSAVRKVEEKFSFELGRVLMGHYKVVSFTTKRLGQVVESSLKLNSEFPVVSLDDRVFPLKENEIAAYLNVRRMADSRGKIIGITEREGYPPVARQVKGLIDRGLTQIELVDDGIWTGETVENLVETLGHPNQVRVVAVYFALAAMEKSERARALLEEREIASYTPLPAELVRDWVKTSHLLDFSGMAGRGDRGDMINMSYWDWLPEWASIPHEHVVEVQELCMKYRFEILRRLERLYHKSPRLEGHYPLEGAGNR